MTAEEVAELKALFDADYRKIVLDLRDVRLADRGTWIPGNATSETT